MTIKCMLVDRVDGKTALITGANSGIGLETTAELARRGASVIMACRDQERAETARDQILKCFEEGKPEVKTKNIASAEIAAILTPIKPEQLTIEILDLSSIESIRAFAERLEEAETCIDFLINNAGVMACPYRLTADRNEYQMGTNHFGHFLLTQLLLPCLKRSRNPGRIICLSSLAHKRGKIKEDDGMNMIPGEYNKLKAYQNSKLANVIHAKQLAKRLKNDGIIAVSVHPGVVKTDLYKNGLKVFKHLISPFMKNQWEGAQTTLYCVLSNNLKNGQYYADCQLTPNNPLADDDELGEKVWKMSEKATGLDSGVSSTPPENIGIADTTPNRN